MESLARTLAVNNTLEELDISNNKISDEGIGHIGTALLTNTTLKTLNISKCAKPPLPGDSYSSSNGIGHICTALRKNTTLKALNVSCSGISGVEAESLAKALKINSSLEGLNIFDNDMTDKGIAHVAKSLQVNKALKSLCVGMTQKNTAGVTNTGMLSLARGVARNKSLKHLDIGWSFEFIDSESTLSLNMMAESVKNSNLKTLTLNI